MSRKWDTNAPMKTLLDELVRELDEEFEELCLHGGVEMRLAKTQAGLAAIAWIVGKLLEERDAALAKRQEGER